MRSARDAEVKVELEVLPDVPAPAIDGIKLERLVVPVAEEAVDTQIAQLASQNKKWEDAPAAHEARTGDQVVIDYAGSVDGVAFEGGTGEGMAVELGSGRLIPGFEDQLVGIAAGEARTLEVAFPAEYPVADLAGKPARFAVTATAVQTSSDAPADDAFAASLGLQSLEQLRGLLKGQLEQQNAGLTRTHMKRKLLDQLAAGHDFPVPPSMVDAEFDQIWQQLQQEADQEADPEAAKAELEAERADYVAIAERRVRLGLLLSEIGTANGVEVTQQEMNRILADAAQQYSPEDRERFFAFVREQPMAAAQLRAPLFEDKVVDFLFGKAEIVEREVTREELEAAIESEDGAIPHVHGPDCGHDHHGHDHHGHDHAPAKPRKAAKAKAEEAAPAEAAPEKPKKAAKKVKAEEAAPAAEAAEKPGRRLPRRRPRVGAQ